MPTAQTAEKAKTEALLARLGVGAKVEFSMSSISRDMADAATLIVALRDSLYEFTAKYDGMANADLFAELPGEEAQRVVRARAVIGESHV